MSNHFYCGYHWEFSPLLDRIALLDALEVLCGDSELPTGKILSEGLTIANPHGRTNINPEIEARRQQALIHLLLTICFSFICMAVHAKESLSPALSENFGDVFDVTIEFVEKPNTCYAQNIMKAKWFALNQAH